MKVLVTGATGFIGNGVVKELLKQNINVIALARNETKFNLMPWKKDVKIICHDIHTPTPAILKYLGSPDILIHLAWPDLPDYKNDLHFEETFKKDYLFLKQLIKEGLKNISVTGTCLEYGLQEGCLTEECSTKPITSYGLGKDTLRKFLEMLKQKEQFNFNWMRLFYVYGENQHPNSLLSQLNTAISNEAETFPMSMGDQIRDFITLEKTAISIVNLAIQRKDHGIINICSENPISVRNFVEEYLQTKKSSIKLDTGRYSYPDYEPKSFWGSAQKLNRLLST